MKKLFIFTIIFLILFSQTVLSADVSVFLNPDNSLYALESFIQDSDSLYLASYTFTSYPLAYDLLDLEAEIKILIDKSPVGGIPDKEILCLLEENDIPVYLYDGDARYMHAKYIVKGNELFIVTENFGNSGFPVDSEGNRGWGAIIKDSKTAEDFLKIFEKDILDSEEFECKLDIDYTEKNNISPDNIELERFTNQKVKTFFAPDNALESILELINSAENYIYVEQFYIYKYWKSGENQFLEALIEKAKQGVEIKILMDSSYYNTLESKPTSNLNTMKYINEIAENENLNLEAKLIDLKALNLVKLHAKVLVADNKTMISSVNWNENSPMNNRESGVIITGDSSEFYRQSFLKDWNTGKVSEINPSGMFIETANYDIYILVFIVSLAYILAWLKKRKL